jgi:hypothetical protein
MEEEVAPTPAGNGGNNIDDFDLGELDDMLDNYNTEKKATKPSNTHQARQQRAKQNAKTRKPTNFQK